MREIGDHAGDWSFQLLSMPRSRHAAAERFSQAPQWSSDLHLVHTVVGRGVLHVGRERYESHPGLVLAVPMFQHCHWEKAEPVEWQMLNLHVRLTEADGVPLHERGLLPIRFTPADLPKIHRQLAGWQELWTAGGAAERAVAAGGVLSLVADYLRRFGRRDDLRPATDAAMQRARELLQQQAADAFDAGSVARAAGLSVSQCNRRFRLSFGVSPKAYWQRHRLALAQAMLASTGDSVTEIAGRLGFSDIYYFSRWFGQQAGVTPTAFRRRHRAM